MEAARERVADETALLLSPAAPRPPRSVLVVAHGSHNKAAALPPANRKKATSENTEMRYIDYCAEAAGLERQWGELGDGGGR